MLLAASRAVHAGWVSAVEWVATHCKRCVYALVDRCCDISGYQIRPGLSGGGGGHSLTWGYEHRGQMAFLTEMWSCAPLPPVLPPAP